MSLQETISKCGINRRVMAALTISLSFPFVISCGPGPAAYTRYKMPSGREIKFVGLGIAQPPMLKGEKAFAISYITDGDIKKPLTYEAEKLELEGYLIMNAEKAGLQHALLEIHDAPPTSFGVHASAGYLYSKSPDGSWRRSDGSEVRPAHPVQAIKS